MLFLIVCLIDAVILSFILSVASCIKNFVVRFIIDAAAGAFSIALFYFGVFLSFDGVIRWYQIIVFMSFNIIISGILYNVLAKFRKILYNLITKVKGGNKNDREKNGASN